MNIVIREVVPNDAQALAHVIVTSIRTAFADLVPDTCLSWLSEDERAALREQALADRDDPGETLGSLRR